MQATPACVRAMLRRLCLYHCVQKHCCPIGRMHAVQHQPASLTHAMPSQQRRACIDRRQQASSLARTHAASPGPDATGCPRARPPASYGTASVAAATAPLQVQEQPPTPFEGRLGRLHCLHQQRRGGLSPLLLPCTMHGMWAPPLCCSAGALDRGLGGGGGGVLPKHVNACALAGECCAKPLPEFQAL